MSNLLIGYSGFVGSNLDHSKYDVFINSKNYQGIENQTFDHVMCCGFSGTKYIANKNRFVGIRNDKLFFTNDNKFSWKVMDENNK